jgi:hypothetical protein
MIPRPVPLPTYENINTKELARRYGLPESWVRNHVRHACADKIPHVKLGGKVIFEWNCEALNEWWNRHRVGYEAPTQAAEGVVDQ